MKTLRSIALLITTLMSSLMAVAQDVIVTVSPAQDVLPPQVLLYLNDPGKYFNITLTNTSASVQQVYFYAWETNNRRCDRKYCSL